MKGTIRRLAASIESRQPLPAWAAAPLLVVGVSLVIAVTGMLWDVGYHIDHGRDLKNLFTAPHLFILFGLLGIGAGALASIVFATYSDDRPGLALGPFRMPYAESHQILFRTEFFNSFNSPQFDLPGGTLGTGTFGVVTGTRSDNRQIQFALKYMF